MENICTIIYANRNRDPARIKLSFDSLEKQNISGFEVIFVDYGSEATLVRNYKKISEQYDFVRFFSLEVSQLLWNKSKALNFGIIKSQGDSIFIADVDLIFHPDSIRLFRDFRAVDQFCLFKLGYLDKKTSLKLSENYVFDKLKPSRFGNVNGMILASKEALIKVNGLDEFFHFYGGEDEDLFCRLENAGYKRISDGTEYFYHNWHKSFSSGSDKRLSLNPRIKNAMRINQRHFYWNCRNKVTRPLGQKEIGKVISSDQFARLKEPDLTVELKNIYAHTEHFLKEELPAMRGKTIEVTFIEDKYYRSAKYRLKKILGKQTQPYISMKDLNDLVLKEIIFNYRNHNYSYKISPDRKKIIFCICL